ncbi:MAG: IS4 family transposase [Acidimicrobiia bacterium]|nr:IS4 family transposase [Acidimicrobiia bacterium]
MRATEDLQAAQFGDVRLTKRLLRLVAALAPDPAKSFPDATGSDAALEATYRFFQNEAVSPERILAPHVEGTLRRAEQAPIVVVSHDTTEFSFSTSREGLGRINDKGRGFFGHFALAVSADGQRHPLGVLGLHTFARLGPPRRERHTECFPETERESFRWKALVTQVASSLRGRVEAVHVMDSEADAYALLASLVAGEHRFVVRLKHNRTVTDECGNRVSIDTKLCTLSGQFSREVALSPRAAPHRAEAGRKRNLTRDSRVAHLTFSATKVTIGATEKLVVPRQIDVNIVHVRETDAPAGTEPVDWRLLTTEPIETPEDIERIVDFYRARWVIEEFFKALKTGCAFEKRQLESLPALLNALAVFTPIACELLHLRTLARDQPDTPASAVFTPQQILVLQRHKHTRLPPHASVRQAMLAVARLGGHIRNNGDPGWIVLGRGYEKLLALAEGVSMALDL